MKLTASIMLIACLHSYAGVVAQKTITLSEKNSPLQKVFKKIKNQSGFEFLYPESIIKAAGNVTIKVTNASLEQAVEKCLEGTQLEFTIVENTVVIKEKEKKIVDIKDADPITGIVRGPNGEPLAGVNVVVKGTKKGTTTNAEGRFSIEADEGDVLEITSVGYGKKEIKANNGAELIIALDISASPLDEVQYIAYGQTSRRFNVGNIGSVKAADIEKQPVNNPLLALQGRVPGLFISQSTGLPGSGVAVRIQGQNTIAGNVGNDPLYVIDGVPYPTRMLHTLSGVQGGSGDNVPNPMSGTVGAGASNPLGLINSADIESIEILKDADATAIYGSRAANGVILITTKTGSAGTIKIDFNIQKGWGEVSRKLKTLTTEQYLDLRKNALANDGITVSPSDFNYDVNGIWDQNRYTDWQKVLIGGTANYTDIHTSLSGGTSNTQFLISPGYHKETTVFPGDLASTSSSLHFSIKSSTPNKKFNAQLSGSYLHNDNKLLYKDLTRDAILLAPNAPAVYTSNETLNWEQLPNGDATWANPLSYLNQEYSNKLNNLIANAQISFQVLNGLQVRSQFGYTNLQSDQYQLLPHSAVVPQERAFTEREAGFSNSNISTWIIEPQINYTVRILNSRFEVLAGTSFQQNNSHSNDQSGTGYSSDLILRNISAAPMKSASTGYSIYRYSALFARVNYNLKDRYVVNINARSDGSSRFGYHNRFHNFASIGGAWIFSSENFFEENLPWLSFGKLKASYGTTGNDQIANYQYLELYSTVGSSVPYQGSNGSSPQNIPNPYLQWEETKKSQFGIELGLFEDQVLLSTSYSINRSSNQLLGYSLPIMTGFSNISSNFPALVQNSDWQFSLITTNFSKNNFSWSSTLNLTIPENKLLEFPNLETSTYANSLVIGQPVSILKAYRFGGVDPATGFYQFIDKNGKMVGSPDFFDRTVLIDQLPKFYGGLQNNFRYGNFKLDLLFQFVKQIGSNYIFGNAPGRFFGTSNIGNQPITLTARWEQVNDVTSIQRVSTSFVDQLRVNNAAISDAAFLDASYVRLKNVSFSWRIPSKWRQTLKLQSAKVYLHAQNLLTFTNYNGLDPETRSSLSLPPLRVMTLGIQVSL